MLLDKIPLDQNEKILATVRQHWFIIVTELLVIVVVGLLPIIILLGLVSNPESATLLAPLENYFPHLLFALAFWLLLSTLAATAAWTHYFLDLWVITNERFIAIEQLGFFSRRVSTLHLERVQDIKASVSGLIPTLLNFGTLRLQTAGAVENNFEIKQVPAPRELQALITTAVDAKLASLTPAPPLLATQPE